MYVHVRSFYIRVAAIGMSLTKGRLMKDMYICSGRIFLYDKSSYTLNENYFVGSHKSTHIHGFSYPVRDMSAETVSDVFCISNGNICPNTCTHISNVWCTHNKWDRLYITNLLLELS